MPLAPALQTDDDQDQLLPYGTQGAPTDFPGRVLPNPGGIKAQWDTEPPDLHQRLSGGAKMITDPSPGGPGSPKMDVSNPPAADLIAPPTHEASARAGAPGAPTASFPAAVSGAEAEKTLLKDQEQPPVAPTAPSVGPGSTADLESRAAQPKHPLQETMAASLPGATPNQLPPPPGKVEYHSLLKQFGNQQELNNAKMLGLLSDPAPGNLEKAVQLHAANQMLEGEKAQVKLLHPWGTPGNHDNLGGKLGHIFAEIGSAAAPGIAQEIPGSRLNLEQEAKKGEAGAEQTIAGEAENAQKNATAAHTEAEIPLVGAQTEEAKARTKALGEKPAATPDEQVLAAGTRIAQGVGTSEDLAVVKSFHDLQQAKAKLTPEKPDTPEQQFIEDYMTRNQGKTVEDAVQAYARATQKPERSTAVDSRSDKSYQYNQGRLDKLRTPIDQIVMRFGRLQDTLNQHNPQADALVGPELLTVMAGGQGSGLRMNEAEIARIVGGRSAWESLKANIQHWATNPDDARSITPDQDRMIRALINTVGTKLNAKQAIIDHAQEQLLNTDDPREHRQITADAQHHLDAIDMGASGMIRARDPQGVLHEAPAGTALPKGWKLEAQ